MFSIASLTHLALLVALSGPGPLADLADAGPDGPAAAAAPLPEVTAIALGSAIADRDLVGEATRFEADGGRIYARLVVDNPGPEATLTMVWRRDGHVVQSLPVTVGHSPRWRTWSYKTLREADVGRWTVEVQDAEGTPIAEAAFEVVPPPAEVSLAR